MARRHGLANTPLLPLLLLLLLLLPALAVDPTFEVYPKEAQPCLYAAAKGSQCSGDTVEELNACLCSGGAPVSGGNGFVYGTALCLGPTVSASVVGDVYDQMKVSCGPTLTPVRYTKTEFMAWAADEAAKAASSSSTTSTVVKTSTIRSKITVTESASSSSTSTSSSSAASGATASTTLATSASPGASSTASATASSSPGPASATGDDNKDTLSTGTTVGIAVGASVAGLSALAGLAFLLIRRSHYSASTFSASPPPPPPAPLQPQPQNVAEMPAMSQVPPSHKQQEQPNFLGAWTLPTGAPYRDSPGPNVVDDNAHQHAAGGPPPPQSKPPGGIFELDSGGSVVAVPQQGYQQYHQSGWQPIAQQPGPPRDYRPYMPQ
ncbi:hypothetical protein ISF_03464 [Cordyceps fumosorosea ARSEF 2679]|uniref:Uncharacterized protein n=1 Tax=Cordyceps fumosorosea (strain ARSEF 2679) TaxID=1081104 RepID=A0A162MRI0_CORFA|nr:hypothetical protein ISF_03464 [Cordyceps fumosorosea ARSEF 2679]OAA69089.1 hypothetical protein ISF_03464 [Cordyceps fumosorosea ARSEF 2679]